MTHQWYGYEVEVILAGWQLGLLVPMSSRYMRPPHMGSEREHPTAQQQRENQFEKHVRRESDSNGGIHSGHAPLE